MMSCAFLLLSLLGIGLATKFELEPLSDEEIFYINSVQSSWTAGRNFASKDQEQVKRLMNARQKTNKRYRKPLPPPTPESEIKIRYDLPKEFDARKQWPQCKSIGRVRDQSACDASWVFAPTEAFSDRLCIHNNIQVNLSAEDPLACCEDCGEGCFEGDGWAVWDYFAKKGVVTGGKYNSSEGCMPYSLPPCDHYEQGKYKPCPKKDYPAPNCTNKCREGYGKTFEEDKHFSLKIQKFYFEEEIMQEIVENGPVIAEFELYEDFFTYKSGIYRVIHGEWVGWQNVKLIGYGLLDGQKYWLAVNSWNEDWGEKGLFMISRAGNEGGIRDNVWAANPRPEI